MAVRAALHDDQRKLASRLARGTFQRKKILACCAPFALWFSIMRKTLPKTRSKPDENAVFRGSVIAQYVRCGRSNCRCAAPGAVLHGPYYYHFWRDGGQLKKRYIPRGDAKAVQMACARGMAQRASVASFRAAHRAGLPTGFKALLRKMERGEL